jgi:hypothetical protein
MEVSASIHNLSDSCAYLLSDQSSKLMAQLHIFVDGSVQESIEFLDRFRQRLSGRFGLRGSGSSGLGIGSS